MIKQFRESWSKSHAVISSVVTLSCLFIISAYAASTDITNIELSNRSASCTTYAGKYISTAKDIQREITFSGNVTISKDGSHCTITSNEVPNHDFNDHSAHFANDLREQNTQFTVPTTPQLSGNNTPLSLKTTEAVLLNGVTIDVLAAACYGTGNEPLGREKIGCGDDKILHPWRYDPMSALNGFGADKHNAHVQPNGKYHYHGNPMALFAQDCNMQATASPVIGFAADGFPVYGSCIRDAQTGKIRNAQSSYVLKNSGGPRQDVAGYQTPQAGTGVIVSQNYDGQFRSDYQFEPRAGDLDECNGMSIDGQYGYYITNSFPWVLNCYKGVIDASFIRQMPTRRMHPHNDNRRPPE